jgi:hypothetical protein
VGLEPTTPGLEVQCSNPTELRGHRISILANLLAAYRVTLTIYVEGRRSIQLSCGRVNYIDFKTFVSREHAVLQELPLGSVELGYRLMVLGKPQNLVAPHKSKKIYGSNRNFTVTLTWAGTALPRRVAGSY